MAKKQTKEAPSQAPVRFEDLERLAAERKEAARVRFGEVLGQALAGTASAADLESAAHDAGVPLATIKVHLDRERQRRADAETAKPLESLTAAHKAASVARNGLAEERKRLLADLERREKEAEKTYQTAGTRMQAAGAARSRLRELVPIETRRAVSAAEREERAAKLDRERAAYDVGQARDQIESVRRSRTQYGRLLPNGVGMVFDYALQVAREEVAGRRPGDQEADAKREEIERRARWAERAEQIGQKIDGLRQELAKLDPKGDEAKRLQVRIESAERDKAKLEADAKGAGPGFIASMRAALAQLLPPSSKAAAAKKIAESQDPEVAAAYNALATMADSLVAAERRLADCDERIAAAAQAVQAATQVYETTLAKVSDPAVPYVASVEEPEPAGSAA